MSSGPERSLFGADEPNWRLTRNQSRQHTFGDGEDADPLMDAGAARRARDEISKWPGYAVTKLVSLDDIAKQLDLGEILYKDESTRFGLGSFKALGGAFAVSRLLSESISDWTGEAHVTSSMLASGQFAERTKDFTVCTATDGNHGRAVAWGAKTFGCRCVVYIHEDVSVGREEAIRSYGAKVIRNPGNYDAAVRRAAAEAAVHGWTVVSDTTYPGYTRIPMDVMRGYTMIIDEIVRTQPSEWRPSHVLIQSGVGAFAAAVCAGLRWAYKENFPHIIVVEPAAAACLLESAVARKRVAIEGPLSTMMAGLACGEVSLAAWPILQSTVEHFATIPDSAVAPAMRMLANAVGDDLPIVAGESAVAGLACLAEASVRGDWRERLSLTSDSRVLLIGTEGATDANLYRLAVGRDANEVLSLQ